MMTLAVLITHALAAQCLLQDAVTSISQPRSRSYVIRALPAADREDAGKTSSSLHIPSFQEINMGLYIQVVEACLELLQLLEPGCNQVQMPVRESSIGLKIHPLQPGQPVQHRNCERSIQLQQPLPFSSYSLYMNKNSCLPVREKGLAW